MTRDQLKAIYDREAELAPRSERAAEVLRRLREATTEALRQNKPVFRVKAKTRKV